MFKGRSTTLFIMAGLMAAGAAWIANQWALNRSADSVGAAVDQRTVVIANTDIPYGQLVEEQHVKVVKVASELVPEDAFNSKAEVVGRIANAEAVSGDVLRERRFVEHLEGSTLASLIDLNMRAISIRVNDVIGVAGFLLPGNRVDVLASRKHNKRYVTTTIVEQVKVLAVDQRASTSADEPVIVRAVTVEVDPRQAEAIIRAGNEGKIQLALRNPRDKGTSRAVASAAPPRSPAPTSGLVVIRGTKVSSERY